MKQGNSEAGKMGDMEHGRHGEHGEHEEHGERVRHLAKKKWRGAFSIQATVSSAVAR